MLPILLLVASIDPGQPIAASVPWAVAPDDGPRTYLERVTGKRIDPRSIAPIREGDMVFDAESMAVDLLAAIDAPLPGLDHPVTPGILIVALNGVTIKPLCGGTQLANGALNCSPLVDQETIFPSAGSDQQKSSILQELKGYYADFNLVVETNRPPDWVPYTLSVIGGTSGNAGYENGICGIANVACDGGKRNHVSLSFSASCPGDAALTAGQETAHNWGLEHTDVEADIMYPFVVGAGSFLDMCMAISHATGSGQTQCSYVHELYCPDGQGEQQNSKGELLGVFGPKAVDTTKPTIVSVTPADGSVFSDKDSINISAMVTDDSTFRAVKWTWVDRLPDDLKEDGYTRCTNEVCTDDYSAWKPLDESWDFLNLKQPPVGHYSFKLEAMDHYGNYTSQTLAFDVVPDGETSVSSGDSTGDPGSEAGSDEGTPTGEAGGDTDEPTGGTNPTNGSATGITGVTGAETMTDPGGDGDDGCGCRSPTDEAPTLAGLALLLGLGARRRRLRPVSRR
jgi:MYXO-CTERM domain-containing protein